MRHSHSVRTRLLVLSAILLLLVAAGQLIFGLFFARPYFLFCKKGEIEDFFLYIKENYSDDPDQLMELLREGEDVDNIRVMLSDGERLLYTSRPVDGSSAARPPFPETEELEFSEDPSVVELPSRSDREALLCLSGMFDYEGQTRYVILWVMVESVESSITVLNRVSLYIVVFVLAVGAVVSVLLARTISRPIQGIQRVSRQVADLDFSARADENVSIRELADLARSVNRMAGHLQESIEELRVANARLREDVNRQKQMEKMRREFIANVSHEMKTPLCLLQMYAENLKYNVDGIDKDSYCTIIIDEAERLNSMVGSMLKLSAIENGMSDLTPVRLDLGVLCRDVMERMAPVLARCRVEGPGDGAFPVRGDPKYLELAIQNYLSNAAAHTPEGGRVAVTLAGETDGICLTVFNQGPNIPSDRLERVWDSFYKVDEARVRTGEVHAGLGLAIVKNVVQRHGGHCGVVNLDGGVAFSFTIPADRETGRTADRNECKACVGIRPNE